MRFVTKLSSVIKALIFFTKSILSSESGSKPATEFAEGVAPLTNNDPHSNTSQVKTSIFKVSGHGTTAHGRRQ